MIRVLAERQHGVLARRQLVRAGIPSHVIDHKVCLGRLQILHLGVYAVGHRIVTLDGRRMAAILAAGPGAALSHRAAASIWELLPFDDLELTAPHRRDRPGLRIHRSRPAPDEVGAVRGIPVTTVPRTLLDLASVLPRRLVERAINEAEVRGCTDPLSLSDLLERHAGRKGVKKIRSILAGLNAGGTVIRSELEARFRDLLRSSGLPTPLINASLAISGIWLECDCLWREQRVIVELDGRAVHATAAAFERDRERDRMLSAHGWRVVRITWRQLTQGPERVVADLRLLLR
jgi:very-short-patch-repair endonuclease